MCLQGLDTIRAFREQEAFQLRCQQLIDASSRAWWPIQACCLICLRVRLTLREDSESIKHGCLPCAWAFACCRKLLLRHSFTHSLGSI